MAKNLPQIVFESLAKNLPQIVFESLAKNLPQIDEIDVQLG